jgi:hypothetical protein
MGKVDKDRLLTDEELREARRRDVALQVKIESARREMEEGLPSPREGVTLEELPGFLRGQL